MRLLITKSHSAILRQEMPVFFILTAMYCRDGSSTRKRPLNLPTQVIVMFRVSIISTSYSQPSFIS